MRPCVTGGIVKTATRATWPLHFAAAWPRSVTPAARAPPSGRAARHSMVATKRRFEPNLQKVARSSRRRAQARVRLHALPQGRQGHQGRLDSGGALGRAWPIRVSSASALVVEGALAHLESRRQEVNDLNVFPVADGDTGDNMALTLRAVLDELDRLATQGARSTRSGASEIVDSVARAALLGARGNSGVILSPADPRRRRGADLPARRARRPGADRRRHGARRRPRLRLGARARPRARSSRSMREMAARVASEIAHMDDAAAAAPTSTTRRRTRCIADVLEHALDAGEASVTRGPELLPMLREAGVVDAGGYGADDHLRRRGRRAARRRAAAAGAPRAAARITHPQHESSTYRYCTNFAVTGDGARRRAPGSRRWRRSATRVLVVGDAHTLKVHVHTDEPERGDRAVRRRRRGLAPRRRRHARAGRASAAQRRRARPGADAALRRARRRRRRRHARAVRGPRRARARRRRRR